MPLFEAKPRQYYIQPLNNQMVFFAGQPIAGVVVLELVEEKKTRGVFVQLIGTVHTHWTERESYRDSRGDTHWRDVHYSQTVEIVNYRSALWLPPGGGESGIMPPGMYSLPFSFVLPPTQHWPPTFHTPTGSIRYMLRSNVDRPWKFDHKVYFPLTLLPLVDANHPQYAVEMRRQDEKTRCCCCCASGPIIATVRVPSAAWCPGELVPFLVTVVNNCGSPLDGVICSLDRHVRYHAQGRSRSSSDRVSSTPYAQVIPPMSTFEAQILLRVPSCCPTIHIESARIIELSYVLDTTVRLPAGSFNMHLRIPVEIVTIPHMRPPLFREQLEAQATAAAAAALPWATPDGIVQQAAAHAVAPSAPPPAYDDVYQGDAEPDHQQVVAPTQYPFFYQAASAPPPPMANSAQPTEGTGLLASAPPPPAGHAMVIQPPLQYAPPSGAPTGGAMFCAPADVAPIPKDD